jgi:hypothetical protein
VIAFWWVAEAASIKGRLRALVEELDLLARKAAQVREIETAEGDAESRVQMAAAIIEIARDEAAAAANTLDLVRDPPPVVEE